MRTFLHSIFLLLSVCASAHGATAVAQESVHARPASRPGEIIVMLSHDGAAQLSRGSQPGPWGGVLRQLGVSEVRPMDHALRRADRGLPASARRSATASATGAADADNLASRVCLLRYDTARVASVDVAVSLLTALDEVELAEPNILVSIQPTAAPVVSTALTGAASRPTVASLPSPTRFAEQWYLPAINMPRLWQVPVIHTRRPVVAILDTGVDVTHPDLRDNIAEGGYNFVSDTTLVSDAHGHGTHCAGLVAAKGYQVVGANPDALVMPITVVDSIGSGGLYDILLGLVHAADHGADIVSLSLGSYASSTLYHAFAAYAARTAIVVAAAGNEGFCMHSTHRDLHGMATPHLPCIPAAYECSIGVMATDEEGQLTTWSNFDCNGPLRGVSQAGYVGWGYQLRVPGNQMLSTLPGGDYGTMSGTSMATPLAAGAISRLLQCRDYDSRDELVRSLIMTTRGQIDVMAAYEATGATLHPGRFTETSDRLALTFVETSDSTAQLGDGTGPAVTPGLVPATFRVPDEVRGLAVTALAPHALEGCRQLATLLLGSSVEDIGESALSGCDALAEVVFDTRFPPTAAPTAFDSGHYATVTLRNARGYAENFANTEPWNRFSRWQELELTTGNRFWETIDGQGTRMSFIIYSLPSAIAQVGDGEVSIDTLRAGHITIPSLVRGLRVLAIAEEAFSGCRLLTSVSLPATLTNIWYKAFADCTGLTEIELPSRMLYIGNYAFSGCTNLRTLKFSPVMQTIGNYAFTLCPQLETIVVPCQTPPTVSDDAFLTRIPYSTGAYSLDSSDGNVYRNATLYVPYGCRQRYAEAPGWGSFQHIAELDDNAVRTTMATTTIPDTSIHDLQGRRLSAQPQRGLYIRGGRKFVVK